MSACLRPLWSLGHLGEGVKVKGKRAGQVHCLILLIRYSLILLLYVFFGNRESGNFAKKRHEETGIIFPGGCVF